MAWKDLEGKAVVYNLTGTVIGLKYYDDFFSVGEFEVWDYSKGCQKTVTVDNLKKEYNAGYLSFIKLDTYLLTGIIALDIDPIIEDTINPSVTNIYGTSHINQLTQMQQQLSALIPNGVNLMENMKWDEFKPTSTYKTSVCECGGKTVGLKDYQAGHSHWCPVYHKKEKTK